MGINSNNNIFSWKRRYDFLNKQGNISRTFNFKLKDRLFKAKDLFSLLKCNLLLVDYRGYGQSEGTPTEEGLQNDAEACLKYLLERKDLNTDNIFICN
jgi:alpha/beta superfamily hydrolase